LRPNELGLSTGERFKDERNATIAFIAMSFYYFMESKFGKHLIYLAFVLYQPNILHFLHLSQAGFYNFGSYIVISFCIAV
jgi:hypothetical protein